MSSRQRLMTRKEFEAFITGAQCKLFVRRPWRLVPCACGDVNCHGWRFVEVRGADAHELGDACATVEE